MYIGQFWGIFIRFNINDFYFSGEWGVKILEIISHSN